MARYCGMNGRYREGLKLLDEVAHPGLADVKARVKRGIEMKERESKRKASAREPPAEIEMRRSKSETNPKSQ
jgi:hypothetical protein